MVYVKLNTKLQDLLRIYKDQELQPKLPNTITNAVPGYIEYEYIKLIAEQLNNQKSSDHIYLHKIIGKDDLLYNVNVQDIKDQINVIIIFIIISSFIFSLINTMNK